MAEKNGVYRVKNDKDYDEINLKTVSDQVKLTDTTTNSSKTLKDFFDGGGTVGGDTTINGNITGKKGISAVEDVTTKKSFRATENIVTETGIVKGKTLQVTGNATVDGTATIDGNTTIGGNLNVSGRYQSGSKIMNLFDKNMCIDGNSGAIRFKYDKDTYLALTDDGSLCFYNKYTPSTGNHYLRFYVDQKDKHTMFRNDSTMIKLLNKGSAQVQARYAGDSGYCSVAGSEFKTGSSIQYKTNIKEFDEDVINMLKTNNVKEYNLKTDIELVEKGVLKEDEVSDKLGFILEELTEDARRIFSPKNSDGVDSYCISAMLWKICQEQQKKIEELDSRVQALENK